MKDPNKYSYNHFLEIKKRVDTAKGKQYPTEENINNSNLPKPHVEYYIINRKIIIKFYSYLYHNLIYETRLISKQIEQCDEIVLDLTKADCGSMTGMGILTYLLMGSQSNPEKKFSVITHDQSIIDYFSNAWTNITFILHS